MKQKTKLVTASVASGALALVLVLTGLTIGQAATPTAPTSANHLTVIAGWGQNFGELNAYTPKALHVFVGDTVTWKVGGDLEPHTITFGPMPLLKKIEGKNAGILVVPQKHGPPRVEVVPRLANPTPGTMYSGGFANSGLLARVGQSWSVTFTKPGRYVYHCMIHFPGMSGVVIVQPRPRPSNLYVVRTGWGSEYNAADAYSPSSLTIHVGDTVEWVGAVFHTVTFASAKVIDKLRHELIMPVKQKHGPPLLVFNPKALFPAGGPTYDGSAFTSSGLLLNPKKTYKLTFTKAGVYHYGCQVHPGMDGTIRVLP